MREKLRHVNSENEIIDFHDLGILINYNELRDYEWSVESENDYITGFTRGVVKKTIPFIFYCSESQANEIKNIFYEHFEKDIINRKKGYFMIGDYRYYCYLTKSKKSDYLSSKRLLNLSIEITTDQSFWVRENIYSYMKDIYVSEENKKYPYFYDYVYGEVSGTSEINADILKACDFKLIIYGPVSNPQISINGHLYNVKCDVNLSEYLIIDSQQRTINIVKNNGENINVFNKRNFDSNIFERIKPGASVVSWSGGFGFDLIIYDERSEPKWI